MNQSAAQIYPRLSLTETTRLHIRGILDGNKPTFQSLTALAGPAIIASVAYIDPGNFATNIQAGARYGYALLWIIILANIMAIFFQSLSAKLGIVTDKNLPELCKEHFPKPVVFLMWVGSEISAMATDLAEFLGCALGLSLLFHIPLMTGMIITGILTFLILHLGKQGFRPLELAIGTLVALVGLCFLGEMFIIHTDWSSALYHAVVPSLPDSNAIALSVGIIGATVMPHAIYLHSGLTQNRSSSKSIQDKKKLIQFSNREVVIALAVAGAINIAIVFLAAAAFQKGHQDVTEIEEAFKLLTPVLGSGATLLFVLSLIFSGISSSTVGTMAGDMIMKGFVNFHIPVWLRRLLTMLPAFVIVAMGFNPTSILIKSQIVLSLTLPLPLIALVIFSTRKDIMGRFANSKLQAVAATICTVLILILNMVLIFQAF